MKKSVLVKECLLVVTTIIWGLGFIAQSIGGKHLDAFTLNASRAAIATVFLFIAVLVSKYIKKKRGTYEKDQNIKELWIGGFLIGAALALAMVLQQVGINSEGAGKSGFLTALYIVFVPFFSVIFGKKLGLTSIISIVLAFIGLYLINLDDSGFQFSTGSLMLLLCAVAYSAQIMLIDKFSPRHDSFSLSCIEFLFATILLIPFSIIFGDVSIEKISLAMPAILFLGIGSSGVAYTIQMYAQKEVNVTVACIIMSLESVFSLIFGVLFLKENHTFIQYMGCVSIFAAVILSQIPISVFKRKSKGHNDI